MPRIERFQNLKTLMKTKKSQRVNQKLILLRPERSVSKIKPMQARLRSLQQNATVN